MIYTYYVNGTYYTITAPCPAVAESALAATLHDPDAFADAIMVSAVAPNKRAA